MLLGREILDQQVIDAAGRQMGKVDGIVLQLGEIRGKPGSIRHCQHRGRRGVAPARLTYSFAHRADGAGSD